MYLIPILRLRDDKLWEEVIRSKCAPQSLSVWSSARARGGGSFRWKCEEDEGPIYSGPFDQLSPQSGNLPAPLVRRETRFLAQTILRENVEGMCKMKNENKEKKRKKKIK